jgi:membrane protein YdbS with pleckstrin-like domain
MRTRNRESLEEGRWRGDRAIAWMILIEFAFLVAVTAVLITFFQGSGFWPWLVMAGAIVVGWLAAVVILIPRSASRR